MDKLSKLIRKLSANERRQLEEMLRSLLSGETSLLDIKKLKGVDNLYRARKGDLRVIFRKDKKDIRVLEVSKRDETTYRRV